MQEGTTKIACVCFYKSHLCVWGSNKVLWLKETCQTHNLFFLMTAKNQNSELIWNDWAPLLFDSKDKLELKLEMVLFLPF